MIHIYYIFCSATGLTTDKPTMDAILLVYALPRLISRVTRLSRETSRGVFKQKKNEKEETEEKKDRKTADARRRHFATIRSRSATLCHSLFRYPASRSVLFLFAPTNLRNGRFVVAIAALAVLRCAALARVDMGKGKRENASLSRKWKN